MPDLPIKRLRTTNPKLLDDDNVSTDAIKRRKIMASKSDTQPSTQSSNNASTSTQVTPSQQASVEAVDDDGAACHNAGSPKSANTILKSVDDEGEVEPEETDEHELSKLRLIPLQNLIDLLLERLQKDWRSKVYAFFQSTVEIAYVDGRKCHEFTCNAKNCKAKGNNPRIVRRYLDTKDRASTKTLRAHAIKCWGQEIVDKSEDAKNITSAREALKGVELRDGSITAVFQRTGKGKVTYSHRTHTAKETR